MDGGRPAVELMKPSGVAMPARSREPALGDLLHDVWVVLHATDLAQKRPPLLGKDGGRATWCRVRTRCATKISAAAYGQETVQRPRLAAGRVGKVGRGVCPCCPFLTSNLSSLWREPTSPGRTPLSVIHVCLTSSAMTSVK